MTQTSGSINDGKFHFSGNLVLNHNISKELFGKKYNKYNCVGFDAAPSRRSALQASHPNDLGV